MNAPSREAAIRFGFTYEGHFRRAVVIKGRIRDTTWYSIISDEWPRLKAAYDTWLSTSLTSTLPANKNNACPI